MSFHKGNIGNLPPSRRIIIWFGGVALPIIFLAGTIFSAFFTPLWVVLLIPDLILAILFISSAGMVFKGHWISIDKDRIDYNKGWSEGVFSPSDIIKVYRLEVEGKDTLMILFEQKGPRSVQNRLLSLGQTYGKNERDEVFNELRKLSRRARFQVLDNVGLDRMKADKAELNWVPI